MTVTTLTTVGFGEINAPLSSGGRWFTLTLIAFGVGAVFVLIGSFTAVLATGELGSKMKRRKMRRRIDDLDGHYIICAYGRVGRSAAEELIRQGAEVVVIDVKDDLEPRMLEDDVPYIIGDPADDDVLEAAGLHRAKALICAVDSDEVNVYITLSARSLNPGLFIVSRASRPGVDRQAGAGREQPGGVALRPQRHPHGVAVDAAGDDRVRRHDQRGARPADRGAAGGADVALRGPQREGRLRAVRRDHPAGPAPVRRRRAHPAEGRQRAGRGRRGDRGGTGLGAHRTWPPGRPEAGRRAGSS